MNWKIFIQVVILLIVGSIIYLVCFSRADKKFTPNGLILTQTGQVIQDGYEVLSSQDSPLNANEKIYQIQNRRTGEIVTAEYAGELTSYTIQAIFEGRVGRKIK